MDHDMPLCLETVIFKQRHLNPGRNRVRSLKNMTFSIGDHKERLKMQAKARVHQVEPHPILKLRPPRYMTFLARLNASGWIVELDKNCMDI